MNIPTVGQMFKVTFDKTTDSFIGKIFAVDLNPENSDRKYKIEQTKRERKDITGHPYSFPDSIIEVEENWFNTELTGRKISII